MATINGTTANDVMTGTTGNDVINGDAGNDRINGGAGDDTIYGGDGIDTLTGDAGNDTLFGGNGNDGFFGGGGNDTLYGEVGDDTLYGDGGNDVLIGGEGSDKMYGGTGDDVLHAGSGDTIVGGSGSDTIVLELSSATYTSAIRDDLAALKAWMTNQAATAGSAAALASQTSGTTLTLNALGITMSLVENAKIMLDGVETPIDSFFNQAPVADAAVSITTDEDIAILGQIVATDSDADVLAYAVASAPAHGILELNTATGAYTYTPGANFNGADSFQVIVTDPSGASVVQTVNVGVSAVNDGPVANTNATLATAEDVAISGQVVASDADGDTLAFAVANGPAYGTLALDAATGAYTYTPGLNFNGADSFQVVATDPSGASVVQTVNVGVSAVNDGPTANATATLATAEDVAVSGQVVASDVDGDTLAYAVANGPAHGTVALDTATGAYTYTATANFAGSDVFSVTVSDGHGGTATQVIKVGVGAVADAAQLSTLNVQTASGAVINGTTASEVIRGTLGNDTINGGGGNDTIYGSGPAGTVTVALTINAALADTDGSESLSIEIAGVPSSATLSAGTKKSDGTWSLTAAQLAGLTMSTSSAADLALTVSAISTEANGSTATTTSTLNVSFTDTDSNVIVAGAGQDTIYGGNGADSISDGGGNDRVYAGNGNDLFMAGSGNDIFDGGAGFDTIDVSGSTLLGATVNLSTNVATSLLTGTDTLISIEGIIGSSSGDTLTGNLLDNRIDGAAGNDKILGGGGNDELIGGAGNDVIEGGSGNDAIYDGAGDDDVVGGSGDDYFFAGSGNDDYDGGTGFDTLDYSAATGPVTIDADKKTIVGFTNDKISNIEKFIGSIFNDSFSGSTSVDIFDGGAGNDTFRGLGGSDIFTGGAGQDQFVWRSNDVVKGNTYLGADTITDFTTGEDKLDIRDFRQPLTAPLDSFVSLTDTAAGTMVSVKVGTGFVDLAMLDGVHGLTTSSMLANGDFII